MAEWIAAAAQEDRLDAQFLKFGKQGQDAILGERALLQAVVMVFCVEERRASPAAHAVVVAFVGQIQLNEPRPDEGAVAHADAENPQYFIQRKHQPSPRPRGGSRSMNGQSPA